MSKAVMLRVGASADGSLSTVFDPLPISARKAAAQVTRELNKASATLRAESAKTTAAHAREAAAQARIFSKRSAEETAQAARGASERERIARREFDARLRESTRASNEKRRLADAEVRAAIRAATTIERAEEQAAKRKERAGERGARARQGTFTRVSGAVGSLARSGFDTGRNALSGMGLDLDIGSHLKKAVDVDKTTRAIANSTALSQNRAVTQADNDAVSGVIHKTGDSAKIDYGEVAGGLDEFVKRSADFKLAKQIFGELGDIAQATGTDFGALAGAAGEIATKLPDTEHKAQDLLDTITAFAGAGAKGSIELSDMAEFLNVLAGGAMKIAGSRVEALEQMNAVAQVARQGGKIDPAEATRSANALMRDMTKSANLKRFDKEKIDVFADSSHTSLKTPKEMIKALMDHTKGDLGKLSKLLPNEMSRAAVEAFGDVYRKDGLKGIDDKFTDLTSGLTPEAMKASAANAKGGDAGTIVEANNKISMSMAKLVPEIEKLIPAITSAATWISSNLPLAIGGAIAASIGKAMIGDAIAKAIGGAGGGAGGAPGGGAFGTLAGGLAIAAGLYVVGRALIDSDLGQLNKASDARRSTELQTGDDRVNAFSRNAEERAKARAGLQNDISGLDQKISLGEDYQKGSGFFRSASGINRFSGWANSINSDWGQSSDAQSVGKDAAGSLDQLRSERSAAQVSLGRSGIEEAMGAYNQARSLMASFSGGAESKGGAGGAAEMKGAADQHTGAAAELRGAAAALTNAAAVIGASGGGGGNGPGVNPAGRH